MSLASFNKLLVGLSFFACTSLFAAPLVVDITGVQSNGEFGDPNNTVLTFNVGANSTITSIDYSLNLTAYKPSWLSEIGLAFTDSSAFDGNLFNPGLGTDASGTETYSGSADLSALGLSFQVGSDGILRLEFYEDWDDFAGPDGQWNFGTITFGVEAVDQPGPEPVPEPASALLVGAGLAIMGYAGRRRRVAAKDGSAVH
jgi:hypothetical protein